MNLKNVTIGMAALLVLPSLLPRTAQAQEAANPQFTEETSKQEHIYRSRGRDVPQGYVIGRTLAAYAAALPGEFDRSLALLGATERWLDIGAGEGQAILDYYALDAPDISATVSTHEQNHKKAQAVAISIEDRRTFTWHKTAARLDIDQMRYLFGKSLNNYTAAELGTFQIITDLLGGFSYTRDLSKFMDKTLSFLNVGGSFYSLLQDVQSETGSNQPYYAGAPYLTEILNAGDEPVKICAWLKRISCVEVTCELKPRWTPPVEIYRVHKICDNVIVPTLSPQHFAAGTPPERRFQLTTPPRASPARVNAAP